MGLGGYKANPPPPPPTHTHSHTPPCFGPRTHVCGAGVAWQQAPAVQSLTFTDNTQHSVGMNFGPHATVGDLKLAVAVGAVLWQDANHPLPCPGGKRVRVPRCMPAPVPSSDTCADGLRGLWFAWWERGGGAGGRLSYGIVVWWGVFLPFLAPVACSVGGHQFCPRRRCDAYSTSTSMMYVWRQGAECAHAGSTGESLERWGGGCFLGRDAIRWWSGAARTCTGAVREPAHHAIVRHAAVPAQAAHRRQCHRGGCSRASHGHRLVRCDGWQLAEPGCAIRWARTVWFCCRSRSSQLAWWRTYLPN